jgi:hypothetical protein
MIHAGAAIYKTCPKLHGYKSGHITTFVITIAHWNHNHQGKQGMIIIELTA